MDWRDIPSLSALRAFEAAARTGSLSAAARELNVTHVAISQHVRTLESRLGVALLGRDGQRMVPTEDGARLAASLTEGFTAIASGVRDLLERDADRPVRVTSTPTFASNWLIPRLGDFWATHPDITVEITPSEKLIDLRRDGFDVAIRYGKGGWPGVDSALLMSARHVVAAAPGLVPGGPVDNLAELTGVTWLLDQLVSEERLFANAQGLDLGAEKIVTFASTVMVREAVLNGLGVTILPEPVLAGEISRGRLEVLFREEDSPVCYHVLTRPDVVSTRRDIFVKWVNKQARAANDTDRIPT